MLLNILAAYLSVFLFSKATGTKSSFFSLCDVSDYNDGEWRETDELVLKSWINSVIPSSSSKKEAGIAQFSSTQNSLNLIEIDSNHGFKWMSVKGVYYNGWLYSETDSKQAYKTNKAYFIYPDFSSALYGTFRNYRIQKGSKAQIRNYRCRGGVMELKFVRSKPDSEALQYTKSFQNSNKIQCDSLEQKNVHLVRINTKESTKYLLKAKRNIAKYSIVAYIRGIFTEISAKLLNKNQGRLNQRVDARNIFAISNQAALKIPQEMMDPENYKATLGHFLGLRNTSINVKLISTQHPVYGEIFGLKSIRNIKKGEKIYANPKYFYSTHSGKKKTFERLSPGKKYSVNNRIKMTPEKTNILHKELIKWKKKRTAKALI